MMRRWRAVLGGLVGAVFGLIGGYLYVRFGTSIPSNIPADAALWTAYKSVFIVWPMVVFIGCIVGAVIGFFLPGWKK